MLEGGRKPVCCHKGVRKEGEQTSKCFLPTPLPASPPNIPYQPPSVCPNVSGPWEEGVKRCRDPLWTPRNASSSAALVMGHGLLSQQPLHPALGGHPDLSQSWKTLAPVSSTGEDSDSFLSLFCSLLSLVLQLSVV